MNRLKTTRLALTLVMTLACIAPALAQDEDDAVLQPAQPDFTLIGMPTSLRLPAFKAAFRVTHRFARPLRDGDFGDLAGDFFGIDNGATIGLEFRMGLFPNTQVGVHRSSNNKTLEVFGEYGVVRQNSRSPIDVSAWLSVEGTNNLQDNHAPSLGAILSRRFADAAAVYVEPIWVNNTNPLPSALTQDNSTFVVGVGARVRIRPTVYLSGEMIPRAAGYKPGVTHAAFAVEKRVGGHLFQLNFSNSWATTMGQLARGGFNNDDWFMGFNIARKFY